MLSTLDCVVDILLVLVVCCFSFERVLMKKTFEISRAVKAHFPLVTQGTFDKYRIADRDLMPPNGRQGSDEDRFWQNTKYAGRKEASADCK